MKRTLLLLALLFLASKATLAQVPSYVPSNGLVGWWPFNGNANDESGNGNHGTAMNGVALTSDRNGNLNSAYSFDGVDDYIYTSNFFFDASSNFTFSVWINSNSNNSQTIFNTIPHTIISYSLNPWWSGAATLGFLYGTGQTAGWLNNSQKNFINPVSYLNVWRHHVVIKSNLTYYFYQDGTLVNTFVFTSLPSNQVSALVFGHCDPSKCSDSFSGSYDDIGIWNRAIDSCEVKDLYYASLGNCCSAAFNTQPQSVNTTTGSNASFVAQSTSLNAIYQWQTNIGLGWQNLSNAGQYYGVTNDTLIVSNLTNINNQQLFRCVLTSGNCSDTSSQALLNVCDGFATQPSSVNAVVAQNASFTISSIASNPIYQWQSDLGLGWQNLSNAGQYSGVTNDTLFVSNLALSNNNQLFRCILNSGTCTDTSATATLSVTATNGVYQLQSESINIYPNPANNQIAILSNAARYPVTYKVYNELGQTILVGELKSNTTSLDISSLATGNYVLLVGTKHLGFVKGK